MVSITRKIAFHAGHMLKDDRSKCHAPHGHEYVLEVTVTGPIHEEGEETGMVMNFGSLKEVLVKVTDLFDHKFILDIDDDRTADFNRAVHGLGIFVVGFAPTAENLAQYFLELISNQLHPEIRITHLKLQETLNCWAEIHRP
jgi:6-pyruvoyltetrahydropterin/6-carboxytetrahydropterin synthase